MGARFVPREVFPHFELPRSYFLGHHKAALDKMKSLMSSTDLILECRDYRIPITSRNPLLEERLQGKERIIVYMKTDLGTNYTRADTMKEHTIREWHHPNQVHFVQDHPLPEMKRTMSRVLTSIEEFAKQRDALTPASVMAVGMPNVGKSTLLNALRRLGLGIRKKAAMTGNMPGVTRSISGGVKILQGESESDTVYLRDTPGVFIPFVPDAEAMLKLALCGSVKDSVIPPVTLCDYLLFRMNKTSPALYASQHPPTNDILALLAFVAKKLGRLKAGGHPDLDATAMWFIQRWRDGNLGQMTLDEVTDDAMNQQLEKEAAAAPSMNQARKAFRAEMKARSSQTLTV